MLYDWVVSDSTFNLPLQKLFFPGNHTFENYCLKRQIKGKFKPIMSHLFLYDHFRHSDWCCFGVEGFCGPPVWQPDEVLKSPKSLEHQTKNPQVVWLLSCWSPDCLCCLLSRPVQPPPGEAPDRHHAGWGEAGRGPVSAGHRTGEAQVHHQPWEEQPAWRAGGRQEEGTTRHCDDVEIEIEFIVYWSLRILIDI